MHPNLTNLQRIDELDRLIEQSQAQPVLLFKHSYTCGSARKRSTSSSPI